MSDFPYTYVGGGYWRANGVPEGESAEILHGQHALDKALELSRQRIAELEASQTKEQQLDILKEASEKLHQSLQVLQSTLARTEDNLQQRNAEVLALREALKELRVCTCGAGETQFHLRECSIVVVDEALSTPPPPVVAREDAEALVKILEFVWNSIDTSQTCSDGNESIALESKEAIDACRAKYGKEGA